MVSWLIIAVLIVLVFLFFKTKTIQHKTYSIIIILFLLFFYVTGSRVIAQNKVDIGTFDGMVTAGKLYVGWIGQVLKNTKDLAGNAIKMDWVNVSTK